MNPKQINYCKIAGAVLLLPLILASCKNDEDPDPVEINPVALDCQYFHESRTLSDNPDAPIDYVINCEMSVKGDLIVEPGVVIAFDQNAGLNVETTASIVAEGTAEKPITLTGVKAEKGYWMGILIDSSNPKNILKYVNVAYGGGDSFQHNVYANIHVYAGANLTVEHCTISNSDGDGLNATGIESTIELHNNTFTENEYPLRLDVSYLFVPDATNDYTGNEKDLVYLDGGQLRAGEDKTWHKINVPYILDGPFGLYNHLLTIEPGVEIRMTSKSYIDVKGGSGAGLSIVGTSINRIVIRGEHEEPGAWGRIEYVGRHPKNEIAYADIKHGGKDFKGTIMLFTEVKINIHNVDFFDLASCGIAYRVYTESDENPDFKSSSLKFSNVGCSIEKYW